MLPEWKGDIVIGSLVGEKVKPVRLRAGNVVQDEDLLDSVRGRFRGLTEGPKGSIL